MTNYKIATWNVNSLRIRLPHVLQWLDQHQPDILALQETKTQDKDFPLAAIEAAGYHVVFAGQKTFNGMAILSKEPLSDAHVDFPEYADHQRRLLAVTHGDIRIVNVYVPNGSSVGSEKYQYKLEWLKHLTEYLRAQLVQYPKTIVLGDFNIAPADLDVYDPVGWEGSVLVSPPERAALAKIFDLGFTDVFRHFSPADIAYSWWDYRAFSFQRNYGLRIDLILTSPALTQLSTGCEIDKHPRSLEQPSDHTPVTTIFCANEPEKLPILY